MCFFSNEFKAIAKKDVIYPDFFKEQLNPFIHANYAILKSLHIFIEVMLLV